MGRLLRRRVIVWTWLRTSI